MGVAVAMALVLTTAFGGQPDDTFGTAGTGYVLTNVPGTGDRATDLAIQHDQKVVVAGTVTEADGHVSFALVRHKRIGDVDGSFGRRGIVITDFNDHLGDYQGARSPAVAVQPDQKIVLAGTTTAEVDEFAVARYHPDGRLDRGFGNPAFTTRPGLLVTDASGLGPDGAGSVAHDVLVQPDGKIVVAGAASELVGDTIGWRFAIARYRPNGALDTGFGGDGIVLGPRTSGKEAGIHGLARQGDGKLVVTGSVPNPSGGQDFAVLRYRSNGTPDPSFGTGGLVVTDFEPLLFDYVDDRPESVTVQGDGKLVVAGTSRAEVNEFALARYHPDGRLDRGFGMGGTGVLVTDVANQGPDSAGSLGRDLVLQDDGRIVVAGVASHNPFDAPIFWSFAVVRYLRNGTPDSSFGDGGIVIGPRTPGPEEGLRAVGRQSNGKLVVAGTSESFTFALGRYRHK